MKDQTLRKKQIINVLLVFLLTSIIGLSDAVAQNNTPIGAINGLFSVGENTQVYFSQGNLQYQASTNTWRFAENQWDFVGNDILGTVYENGVKCDNELVSSTYSGWIDLFHWGTSGYDHGAVCYQPWSTSLYENDYAPYGGDHNLSDSTGKADWGYNPIINGGNQEHLWHTPSSNEWAYILFYRNTPSGVRFAKATVNEISGVIILPDDWVQTIFVLNNANDDVASYASNVISANDWNSFFEANGAVFLPDAGYGDGCSYNSSTGYSSQTIFVHLSDSYLFIAYSWHIFKQPVRLIRPVQGGTTYSINAIPNPAEGGTVSGGGTYEAGVACTLTAIANEGYTFVDWTVNGATISTETTYTFTVTSNRTLVANFAVASIGSDHAYVNLGLPSGLLWATCNVGADSPEDYGDYFAWGETQPKDTYNWSTYPYCNGSGSTLTKYCNNSSYGYNGFTDNLTTLLPEDDVATANWGSDWRMPTKEEWQELLDNTTVTWTTQNGVYGRLFTASNGNSLFLPAGGDRSGNGLYNAGRCGHFWSSSLNMDDPDSAWRFYLDSGGYYVSSDVRDSGRSVRLVRPASQNTAPTGAINGLFSVGENAQVYFSQGNLQYQASTNTWRFAENQWDYVGNDILGTVYENGVKCDNELVSSTYSGWIDLFHWGTSGYDHGAVCYQPWSTSLYENDYAPYGGDHNLSDSTGKADWGYNPIINGGNQEHLWHTPSSNEWAYILFYRNTPSGVRFAKATVNEVRGVIVLPDDWAQTIFVLNNANDDVASYTSNVISANDWNSFFEANGAVFLPDASYGDGCSYNSSTGYSSQTIFVHLSDSYLFIAYSWHIFKEPVRLIRPAQGVTTYSINANPNPAEGGTVNGGDTYEAGAECTLTATATEGYIFTNWTENGEVVSTNATYTFTVTGNRNLVANFTGVPSSENIVFADDAVKAICVEHWDTNGDGEQSYAEAAAVTSLNHAFKENSTITSFNELMFFTGLSIIDETDFYRCYHLAQVILPNTVTSIGALAFEACPINTIVIPSAVVEVWYNAFLGASQLEQIIVENGNPVYDSRENCNAIIETNTNTIIAGCKNTIIPSSVTAIGDNAFSGGRCQNSVFIPSTIVSVGLNPFQGCESIQEIIVASDNPFLDSRNNCNAIIETNTNKLITGCVNTMIPNTVVSIERDAFYFIPITSVTIPASVSYIGQGAFMFTSLSSITVLAQEPPVLDQTAFLYLSNELPVYVPCGTSDAYQNTDVWSGFTNYIEMCDLFSINAVSNPTTGGTIIGAGNYDMNVTCTLTATANEGYTFVNWTENGEVVSTNATYTFTVTGNRNLVANFSEIIVPTTNHWIPETESFEDNMTFTAVIQIDGVEQYSPMLEVGAFCGEQCRGSQLAALFEPTQRYLVQLTIFGEINDLISFRLFDHATEQELDLSSPAPVNFSTNGYGTLANPYALNFTSAITQAQALNNGWNWWSTYVETEGNNALEQLENSLGDNGLLIKSRNNGYAEPYNDNGTILWYGTLSALQNEQTYKINTNSPCVASITGLPVNPDNHPITLKTGWNWIGFPSTQNVSVATALSGLEAAPDDIIKGRNGYASYYAENGYNGWYGTINTLESGQGYMYRSNSNDSKTFTYTIGRGETAQDNITPDQNLNLPQADRFADNMTVTAVVKLEGAELHSETYEVAAFVGNECRGSVKLMYVAPIDRYVAFLTIFGEPGDELSFHLTDGVDTSLSEEGMTFVTDGSVGSLSNPATLRFVTLGVDENLSNTVSVYPNPSEGLFLVKGQGMRNVAVFNVYGQCVLSEAINGDEQTIDMRHHANGIYTLRVITDRGVISNTVVKQ